MKVLKEQYEEFRCEYCGKKVVTQIGTDLYRCDNCGAEYECSDDDKYDDRLDESNYPVKFTVVIIDTNEPVQSFDMKAAADEFVNLLGKDKYKVENYSDKTNKSKPLDSVLLEYDMEYLPRTPAKERKYFMNGAPVDRGVFYDALVNVDAGTEDMLALEDEEEIEIKGIKYKIEKSLDESMLYTVKPKDKDTKYYVIIPNDKDLSQEIDDIKKFDHVEDKKIPHKYSLTALRSFLNDIKNSGWEEAAEPTHVSDINFSDIDFKNQITVADRDLRRKANSLFLSKFDDGKSPEKILVHHIDGNEAHNTDSNLVAIPYKDSASRKKATGLHFIIEGDNLDEIKEKSQTFPLYIQGDDDEPIEYEALVKIYKK